MRIRCHCDSRKGMANHITSNYRVNRRRTTRHPHRFRSKRQLHHHIRILTIFPGRIVIRNHWRLAGGFVSRPAANNTISIFTDTRPHPPRAEDYASRALFVYLLCLAIPSSLFSSSPTSSSSSPSRCHRSRCHIHSLSKGEGGGEKSSYFRHLSL